jgi:DNA-binding MarR family transcriptional regulator
MAPDRKLPSKEASSEAIRPDGSPDHVDRIRAEWEAANPAIDTSPLEVVARAGRLASYFDAGIERVLGEHGLSRASWDILAGLRRIGPPFERTPSELHSSLMRSSGWMTNRLHRLEKAGLVERRGNPDDGRSVRIGLTAEGLALVDEVAPLHMENEERMLRGLSPEQRETLAGLLRAILFDLEADGPPPRRRRRSRRC